jgi:hypothetical protein
VLTRVPAFDNYTNDVLTRVPAAPGVMKVEALTPALLAEYKGAVPGVEGTFVVIKTNEGRFPPPARPGRETREPLRRGYPRMIWAMHSASFSGVQTSTSMPTLRSLRAVSLL